MDIVLWWLLVLFSVSRCWGEEFWSLCMLGKCSATESPPQPTLVLKAEVPQR